MFRAPRVLIHAEVELAAIDGSTSWLISVSRAFALAGADVEVVARNVPTRSIVVDEIRRSGVRVTYPNARGFNDAATVARFMELRFEQRDVDLVLVRGESTALELVLGSVVGSSLWYYIVGLPRIFGSFDEAALARARAIASSAGGLFSQTNWLNDYVLSVVPEAHGKTVVLPPMVPEEFFNVPRAARDPKVLRLGYAGKFDRPWHTLEIPLIPGLLQERGVEAEVVMHGDKVQSAKGVPDWHVKMRGVIGSPPAGVSFPGPLSRSAVAGFMASCDLGIGWRDSALDNSYEISTKLLEFSAVGVPVICNDTAIHRSIFGEDYPFYVEDDIYSVIDRIAGWRMSSADLSELSSHVSASVRTFSISATALRLGQVLNQVVERKTLVENAAYSVGYVHSANGGGGLASSLIGRLQTSSVSRVVVGPAARVRDAVGAEDVVLVDFERRSLDAVSSIRGRPVVGLALGADSDVGLANPFRLGRLAGLISTDLELIMEARRAAPRCKTLLLSEVPLAPYLRQDSSLKNNLSVSIVLNFGDLKALEGVAPRIKESLDISRSGGIVRIVLMKRDSLEGLPDGALSLRFSRELQHLLARFGDADLEVLTVADSDSRWIRDTALLVNALPPDLSSLVEAQLIGYSGSLFFEPTRSSPLVSGSRLERKLDWAAFERSRLQRPSDRLGAGASSADRVSKFLGALIGRSGRE